MDIALIKRITIGALTVAIAGGVTGISTAGAFASSAKKSVTGNIATLAMNSDRLTINYDAKSDAFTTTAATKVELGGKQSALAALKDGDTVKVSYHVSGKTFVATSIATEM